MKICYRIPNAEYTTEIHDTRHALVRRCLRLVRQVCWCCRLLEVNLVNLHLPVYEFINVHHDSQAINVHEDKARVDIISDAAEGTGGRSGINDNSSLVFVSSELVCVAGDKDVYI